MISCTNCYGEGYPPAPMGCYQYKCSVCEGFGRAPGCETCQRIPDSKLPTKGVHNCECGVWWGLDTNGTRYWVAPVNLSELKPALKG